jgi:putative ABC transport system substrate-binding protein
MVTTVQRIVLYISAIKGGAFRSLCRYQGQQNRPCLRSGNAYEIESAFEALIGQRVNALVVSGEIFFLTQRDRLVALAARHALPTIYAWREFPIAGGLMSYGTDFKEPYRLIGEYAGRILKGEKPANLPVQQASKVELVINQKTAKALGISVPQSLISRADEVIE